MTCFWDGIIQSLLKNKIIPNNSSKKPIDFVKYLKEHNKKTINVTCNNEKLTDKQLQENYEHINQLKIENINQGYDCSTFDPFLFLVSQHFQVDIIHRYCNIPIKYTYTLPKNKDSKIIYNTQVHQNKKTLIVFSNKRHFWTG